MIVGSPLEPEASALPIRASFVPWLFDLISQRLAGELVDLPQQISICRGLLGRVVEVLQQARELGEKVPGRLLVLKIVVAGGDVIDLVEKLLLPRQGHRRIDRRQHRPKHAERVQHGRC